MPFKPIYETTWEQLPISVYRNNREMGAAAAQEARGIMQAALADGAGVQRHPGHRQFPAHLSGRPAEAERHRLVPRQHLSHGRVRRP